MKPLRTPCRTIAVAASIAGASVLLWVGVARGLPSERASLNNCQNAVRTAAASFVKGKVSAIGTCLQAVSKQLIQNDGGDASGAALTCVKQLRKLNDSRGLGKSLPEKLTAAIQKGCDPALNPKLTHTLADVLGPGAGVSQPIDADNIASWCANFGGNGSIASIQDWLSCILNAQECGADMQISTQYPRALEWLAAVRPAMNNVTPPSGDPSKVTDAVAALDEVRTSLQGGGSGNVPHFGCGGSCGDGLKNGSDQCDGSDLGGATCVSLGFASGGTLACTPSCALDVSGCSASSCGDSVKNGSDQCDGSDLGGATCVSLGFAPGGTLACAPSCALDVSGCSVPSCGDGVKNGSDQCDGSDLGGVTCVSLGFSTGTLSCTGSCALDVSGCQVPLALPATGQTTQYVGNDDGAMEAGATLSYTDNGDGTITDNNTGLMWEKKVALDSSANGANPHDADNCYDWAGNCSGSGAYCGVDADCPSGQTCGAGSPSDCFVGATIYQWVADLSAANFAGHNDWRIPNVKELQSIVDYGRWVPAVAPAFNGASCGASCTDMTSPACSCTQNYYWSSTTSAYSSYYAWLVYFHGGYVRFDDKSLNNYVRAVRGGS
jgi:hypothetical protein